MKYFSLLLIIIALFACDTQKTKKQDLEIKKYTVVGKAQGTYYQVVYFNDQMLFSQSQIDSIFNAFDQSASNYQDSSIISKINYNIETEIDKIFIDNFNIAKEVHKQSNGYFDITVRPLIEYYGFGKKEIHNTDSLKIDSIMQFVGFDKVKIENDKIIKVDDRIQLDFNAVAQGYSVDYISKLLKEKSCNKFLVDVGGEVYASGMKNDSTYWKVGVEKPKDNAGYGDDLSFVIKLRDKGMATSGNYRKFFEKEGKKYVHTINPMTGETVISNLLSATVISENTAMADACATAIMAMGLERGKKFAEKMNIEILLIYANENGDFEFYISDGMKEFIK